MCGNNPSSGATASENDYNLLGVEADIGSKGPERISNCNMSSIGSSPSDVSSSDLPTQSMQGSMLHGIPDFFEVYSFIGSVFDPAGKDQKLKEIDPINFETVLLLTRNLTINLSSPDFEPIPGDPMTLLPLDSLPGPPRVEEQHPKPIPLPGLTKAPETIQVRHVQLDIEDDSSDYGSDIGSSDSDG